MAAEETTRDGVSPAYRHDDIAIGQIKKKTSRHQKYSEGAAHLRHVKNAWRDPTMHNRRRDTAEEATAIFENVKTFVSYLATEIF